MIKRNLRLEVFNFLEEFDTNIRTKFNNISSKTGRYDVPDELFQKRCKRSNRVLISWKTVNKNNLTMAQLNTFSGGVVVEFVNEDYFLPENHKIPLFQELVARIGCDELVSSIITIRSESGSSSSSIQRENFEKLTNDIEIKYKNDYVVLNKSNYQNYAIKRLDDLVSNKVGIGNEKWTGFLYVSIKGGQQDTIESHSNINPQLFNPACEFATNDVCEDINLVMSYFAFLSINPNNLMPAMKYKYIKLLNDLKLILSQIEYDCGNLLTYCQNHPSVKMFPGKLYDPIQIRPIDIYDFAIADKEDNRNIDFTHDEAVNKNIFYWDNHKQCILSPARPTNVFWSKHFSNMMQQNLSLEEYFKNQEEIVKRRSELLRNNVIL